MISSSSTLILAVLGASYVLALPIPDFSDPAAAPAPGMTEEVITENFGAGGSAKGPVSESIAKYFQPQAPTQTPTKAPSRVNQARPERETNRLPVASGLRSKGGERPESLRSKGGERPESLRSKGGERPESLRSKGGERPESLRSKGGERPESLRSKGESLRPKGESLRSKGEGLRSKGEGLRSKGEGLRSKGEGLRSMEVNRGGRNKLPVTGGRNKLPVTGGLNKLPVTGGRNKLPVTGGLNKLPVTGGLNKLPVTGGRNKLPVTAALKGASKLEGGGLGSKGVSKPLNNLAKLPSSAAPRSSRATTGGRKVPRDFNELESRDVDEVAELVAREFAADELEARDFEDFGELEARDFEDFEELSARDFDFDMEERDEPEVFERELDFDELD